MKLDLVIAHQGQCSHEVSLNLANLAFQDLTRFLSQGLFRYVTFEDLEADDNGSYINNGSPTHTFECDFIAEKLTKCKRIATKRLEGRR